MQPARLARLHAAVDRQEAEMVTITPMQAGGYVANQTPSGPPESVEALIGETSSLVRTSGNAANSGHNVELRGATHTAKFTTSALPFTAQAGFVLTRIKDPALPQYRVAAVLPNGADRTILMLVKMAGQSQ